MRAQPSYSSQLEAGEWYQEIVASAIKRQFGYEINYYTTRKEQYEIGESVQGFEIKYDRLIAKTGRLSIEIAEKTRADLPNFTPSGIFRQDNTIHYAQGDASWCWCFRKTALQEYYCRVAPPTIDNNPPTIIKFYLSIEQADQLAWKKIRIGGNQTFEQLSLGFHV